MFVAIKIAIVFAERVYSNCFSAFVSFLFRCQWCTVLILSNSYACHAGHYSLFLQSNQSPDFFVLTHSRSPQSLSLKNWTKYTWYFIYLLRLLSTHVDLSNIVLVWCSIMKLSLQCNLNFELYRCWWDFDSVTQYE